MSIASEFLIWRDKGCILCRVTTNVSEEAFLARLRFVGLGEEVATVHAVRRDRVNGGNGFELRFVETARWDDVYGQVVKL